MDVSQIYNKNDHSIKLGKTTRGWTWEIKIYGEDTDKIIEKLQEVNGKMQKIYGEAAKEK